jgi:hypothetical protein
MRLAINGGTDDRVAEFATTSTFAGLRIAFDASTKVLSAYYDEDGPNCGYAWTLLGSTNISAAWTLTPTNLFRVWVQGRVEEQDRLVTSADNLYADNFYASSGTVPNLGITLAGTKAVFAWSTNGASCYPEFTTTLAPPVCWQIGQEAPSIVGTNFTLTNTVSGGSRFYRLGR